MDTRRILIVGVELQSLDGLAASVQRYCLGCEVAVANGGGDAIRQFQQSPFDLILTEYDLPDMTGVELAQAVHRVSPATRIVLMVDSAAEQSSGSAPRPPSQPGEKERPALNSRDTIRKPVGIEQLWRVVHSLN